MDSSTSLTSIGTSTASFTQATAQNTPAHPSTSPRGPRVDDTIFRQLPLPMREIIAEQTAEIFADLLATIAAEQLDPKNETGELPEGLFSSSEELILCSETALKLQPIFNEVMDSRPWEAYTINIPIVDEKAFFQSILYNELLDKINRPDTPNGT